MISAAVLCFYYPLHVQLQTSSVWDKFDMYNVMYVCAVDVERSYMHVLLYGYNNGIIVI